MHTYIPAYLHTYIPTYLHTYIHTYIHTYVRTYIHAYMHTCIHAYIHRMCTVPFGSFLFLEGAFLSGSVQLRFGSVRFAVLSVSWFLRFAVPSFAVLVGAGHFESSTRTEGCRVGWGCFCSHRSPATQPSSFSHYSGWWLEGGEGGRVTGWGLGGRWDAGGEGIRTWRPGTVPQSDI